MPVGLTSCNLGDLDSGGKGDAVPWAGRRLFRLSKTVRPMLGWSITKAGKRTAAHAGLCRQEQLVAGCCHAPYGDTSMGLMNGVGIQCQVKKFIADWRALAGP